MRQRLYVISDLHLGGAPAQGDKAGFQICPPATQQAMAGFIHGLPKPDNTVDTRLVIAGDIVDFLAEEPFCAFTPDEAEALNKFRSIVANTQPVWDALGAFVAGGGALTLMLGNHDIELSLPALRAALVAQLAPLGGGRIEFIYDNEAFTLGPVLIEHGNRFDAWNAVPHGALRRVRSQLSRKLPVTPDFPLLPGSRLVVDVMNGLKKDYPFIDLLKPEKAAALPVAAALGAGGLRDVWRAFGNFSRAWFVDYDEVTGEPANAEYVGASGGADAISEEDREYWDLAQELIGEGEEISALERLRDAAAAVRQAAVRKALFTAMQKLAQKHRQAYAIDYEDKEYLKALNTAAGHDWRVIVYGHTHLPKRMVVGAEKEATYLNTGTWADLMRMPDDVWQGTKEQRQKALDTFVGDLAANRLNGWRRSLPTYARIELDDALTVTHADVHFASDHEPISTEAIWERLRGGAEGEARG